MCPPMRPIARSSTPNPLPSTCCDLKSSEAAPLCRTTPIPATRTCTIRTPAAPRTTTANSLDIAALSPSPRGLEPPREASTTPTDKSQTRRSMQPSASLCIRTPRNTQTRTIRIPGRRPSLPSTPDPCSPWSPATSTTPSLTDDLRDRSSAISAGTNSFPRSTPRPLKRASGPTVAFVTACRSMFTAKVNSARAASTTTLFTASPQTHAVSRAARPPVRTSPTLSFETV